RAIPSETRWAEAFDFAPIAGYQGINDLMLVFDSEAAIRALEPKFDLLNTWPVRGVIVTARGESCDFVSRFFAPRCGIAEDPVTGSAHTTLTPYWADRLGKPNLTAEQLSERVGILGCTLAGDRVQLTGQARLYMKGEIGW
ncbi:MAG: PhzF family phenazine biosynthesis protein, partial [Bacteroidota bacterium]